MQITLFNKNRNNLHWIFFSGKTDQINLLHKHMHPTFQKQKSTPQGVFFISGGSGWIRTSSGLSQQIYSLPRLSNSGARPNFFATNSCDFQLRPGKYGCTT